MFLSMTQRKHAGCVRAPHQEPEMSHSYSVGHTTGGTCAYLTHEQTQSRRYGHSWHAPVLRCNGSRTSEVCKPIPLTTREGCDVPPLVAWERPVQSQGACDASPGIHVCVLLHTSVQHGSEGSHACVILHSAVQAPIGWPSEPPLFMYMSSHVWGTRLCVHFCSGPCVGIWRCSHRIDSLQVEWRYKE